MAVLAAASYQMSMTNASPPPSPLPAATSAAGSANLGTLRHAIPVTKHQALIRARVVGYAYEFDHGFVWHPEDSGPQAYRWDQVATVNWFASQHYSNGVYTGTQYWLTLASTDARSLKFSGSCKDPAAKGGRNADPLAPGYLLYQFLSPSTKAGCQSGRKARSSPCRSSRPRRSRTARCS